MLNTKPDGTGTDVITFNDTGVAEFKGSLGITAASAAAYIKSVGGQHPSLPDGPSRDHAGDHVHDQPSPTAICCFSWAAATSSRWKFYGNLFAHGGAYLQGTTGNVVGTVWSNWGAGDAYSAISARIEARAQAWAINYANSCVQSWRMAGYIEFNHTSGQYGVSATYGGYVMVMSRRISGDNYLFGFRQPQLYTPAGGWVTAFPF